MSYPTIYSDQVEDFSSEFYPFFMLIMFIEYAPYNMQLVGISLSFMT
jgi:hypothetical protein